MELRVELHGAARAWERLDAAGERVAPEQEPGRSAQLDRLHDAGCGIRDQQGHLGARGHVEARLDDRVVADRDADAGVRSEQGASADD